MIDHWGVRGVAAECVVTQLDCLVDHGGSRVVEVLRLLYCDACILVLDERLWRAAEVLGVCA